MNPVRHPNFVKLIIHTGWNLFFPRRCFDCRREGERLCANCLDRLPRCWSSGLPAPTGVGAEIFSVFDYGSPIVKQAIWSLKYRRALDLAETFARPLQQILVDELADRLDFSPAPIVLVPVPLSPKRRRQRGYNQAAALAEELAALDPNQFELRLDLIKKIKNTPAQVTLKSRGQRLANLKGAFALGTNAWPAPNQIVVIVDDVTTTGATINEVSRTLRQADPATHWRIYGLTVAHG